MIKKIAAFQIPLLLILLLTLSATAPAIAQGPPAMPNQFYGTVTLNGSTAPSGTTVAVYVSGAPVASVNVDSQGKYGYSPVLSVSGTSGAILEFYVGGVKASQTPSLSSGAITRLNLTATGSPGPLPTAPVSCGISTTSLPPGTVGTYYSASLAVSGGTTPYTWTLVGTLPAGLTLNSSTGIISGTPTAANTYNFTIKATDGSSNFCTKALSILINAAAPAGNGTAISASILGGTDTFFLSNNVLAAAKELASSDGRVRLSLPAGAAINMQGATQLGAATESNPPASTDGSTLVRAYSFIPSGATFSPAATMTLKYETASLPAGATESGLYIAYWNGTAWEKLNSTVNTATKEVSAPVSHFTIFAIRYQTPTTASTTTTTTSTTATTGTTTSTGGTSSTSTTAATTTPVTVSANVLGTTSSFSTSGGAVSSASSLSSSNGKMGISLAANTAVSLPSGSQQITVIQLASPPTPPADSKVIEAYAFGPDNTTFNPAASVTLKYDPAGLPADVQEANLYVALLENSDWTEVPCTIDTQTKMVTAKVSHFSTYALLGRVTAAPVAPVTPTAPEAPMAPATTPATTPAAAGSSAASDMSMPILFIIIAGGLLVIVLAVILVMRQRSSGY